MIQMGIQKKIIWDVKEQVFTNSASGSVVLKILANRYLLIQKWALGVQERKKKTTLAEHELKHLMPCCLFSCIKTSK